MLQAFRGVAPNHLRWVWLAVLAHAALDGITVFVPQVFGSGLRTSVAVEGVVAPVGVAAILTIWRLREQPVPAQARDTAPASVAP